MSAIQVKCIVTVDNVHWVEGLGCYLGSFKYQQVSPLDKIYIAANGTINLKKIGVTAPVDVTYFWATQAIEIEGELYPATLADPVNDSFLVVPGNAKPGFANKAPVNGADITVMPGGASELVMKDANSPAKLYTYNLAIRIGIDGGKWLIDDPRIINTGVTRLYSYEEQTSA